MTNASPSTVYLIIRQLTEEGKIRTELGSGSFFVGAPTHNRAFRIALNIPRISSLPHDDYWKNGITSGILSAASEHPSRMMIMPCSIDAYEAEGINKEILAERDEVDALILFPTAASAAVRESYESAGKFVVDLNSPNESVTSNFVSPDYFQVSYRIGKAWAASGRKRILFMSHVPLNESVSSRQRWAGLICGIGEALSESTQCMITVSNGSHEEDGARAMAKFLQNHKEVPDAIYCVGDCQANGVLRTARNAGIKVPEALGIISGTGLDLGTHSELAKTRQPFQEFGRALVDMVANRLRVRGSVPAIYLPMDIIAGGTLTMEENSLLGAISLPQQRT